MQNCSFEKEGGCIILKIAYHPESVRNLYYAVALVNQKRVTGIIYDQSSRKPTPLGGMKCVNPTNRKPYMLTTHIVRYMPKERWTHSKTCVDNIGYHLIWCPRR